MNKLFSFCILTLLLAMQPLFAQEPQAVKIDIRGDNFQIKGTYPQFTGDKIGIKANQFNKLVQYVVNARIVSFKKEVLNNNSNLKNLPPDIHTSNYTLSYDVNTVQLNKQQVVSVLFKPEVMLAGSAHPSHPDWVLNYNLTTGATLTLAGVFKSHPSYLQQVSTASREMLIKNFRKANYDFDNAWLQKGTAPKLENFQLWNVTSKGLQVTFAEYQVAPYAAGIQTITLPY